MGWLLRYFKNHLLNLWENLFLNDSCQCWLFLYFLFMQKTLQLIRKSIICTWLIKYSFLGQARKDKSNCLRYNILHGSYRLLNNE
jgi:hypothetical protein